MTFRVALSAVLLAAGPAAAAEQSTLDQSLATDRVGPVVKTVEAAIACTISAGSARADDTRFAERSDWKPVADGTGFVHQVEPVTVIFPKDDDGIARRCEVRSSLASQADQNELTAALEVLLKVEPKRQADGLLWLFSNEATSRQLQFFPDRTSDRPKVRFVATEF